ncbi:hypothetical protein Pyn_32766 [Prunus yedoensis var. nudiflora]|uniref:Uncharacterized protein n=1 Tax=Prunus yedoensis var. nudiflora TaxID=2094558 RepID=A0A314UFI0_PRUYE|nr:hypothetical protein Pyn_32766 [Prunus yedoensis var. nudiflora]
MTTFRLKHRNWKWIIYSNHDLPRGLDAIDIKVDASKASFGSWERRLEDEKSIVFPFPFLDY